MNPTKLLGIILLIPIIVIVIAFLADEKELIAIIILFVVWVATVIGLVLLFS